jgi:hypothetical protein
MALFHAINKFAFVGAAIPPDVFASAVWFAKTILASVHVAIGESVGSAAVF